MSLIIETNSFNINAIPSDKIVLTVNKGAMLRDKREKSSNNVTTLVKKGAKITEKETKLSESGIMLSENGEKICGTGAKITQIGAKFTQIGAI